MSSAKAFTAKASIQTGRKNKKQAASLAAVSASNRQNMNRDTLAFGLMLFLSGVAALIYQVLWIRQLTLIVGIEVYSITIAVSAFFAGLAAGSAVLGPLADRSKHPLLFYSLLEICVGLIGFAATIVLGHAAFLFVAIQTHAGFLAWALPFLLVGIPAFVMGGTLPVAIRWHARSLAPLAEAAGWVYAVNTCGAAAGALLSSFVFLPWLGVRGTAMAAAIINLMAAGIALALNRRGKADYIEPSGNKTETVDPPDERKRSALALYAVAGGIALGYEVVWSQAMAQFLSTRVFAFSVVLATYLAGLVIGSALYARIVNRVRDAWTAFGLLISAAGFVALFEVAFLNLWQLRIQAYAGSIVLAATGNEFARMCAQFLVAALGIVFVPTVLLGAAFPAALRLTADARRAGRDVGITLALNTAGGIAGSLLTGFLLIPAVGLVRTLSILAVAAVTVGVISVLLSPTTRGAMRWAVYLLGLAVVAGGILTPPDRLARLLLTTRGGGDLVFYQESRGATVAVAQQGSADNVFRRLYIQGVSNSGDAMPSLRYLRLQGMLPLLIHRGQPHSALIIGFGTGITAGSVLHYPNMQRRLCVELLPAVVHAGALFPENYKAGSSPDIEIRIADGRHELMRNNERYDVITLEPPPPSAEGVVNLYSTEFYRLAGRRLEPDGLIAQWLPLTTQNDRDTRSLVRSFLNVFPYTTLWSTELHETLLIGSFSPIELNTNEIAKRFAQPNVSTALQAVGIASPAALLATWITDRDGLESYAAGARPVTDNDPRIEYSAWVRPKEITRTLPNLLALRTNPPLIGADDAFRAELVQQQQSLLDFYAAGIAAYNGDREAWSQSMQKVFAIDSNNAYYRWIAGNGK
jgi:spermidine synthase